MDTLKLLLIKWEEIVPYIDLKGLCLPTPFQRHLYLSALHRRKKWPKEKFASVEIKGLTIYSSTHTEEELRNLPCVPHSSDEKIKEYRKAISNDAWALTNIGWYAFSDVHHPLYHDSKGQDKLWNTLDCELICMFPEPSPEITEEESNEQNI